MWPFTKKYSLGETDLMKGFTDWHSHILPGVDDGVRTLDESLSILDIYEHVGVNHLWLTPHVMEDTPNSPAVLRARFAELKEAYKGNVKLHLAAENMLDNLFDERLAAGDVLPIGEDGMHLLVETSYFTPPFDLDDKITRIKAAGYYPILAHPERYVYMDDRKYRQLLDMDVKFQLNIYSFTGAYGEDARAKAKHMLKKGWYSYIGTDTHRIAQLQNALAAKEIHSKDVDRLQVLADRLR